MACNSPDLNPLDFFVSGYSKILVYGPPINSHEELQRRINEKYHEIPANEAILERFRISNRLSCLLGSGTLLEGSFLCLYTINKY